MESNAQERRLVAEAQKGNRVASDRLTQNYYDRLVFLIASRLGPRLRARVSAEDLAQETFKEAFKPLHRFEWKGDRSFFAWLRAIAEHVIQNAARRDRRHPEVELKHEVPQGDPTVSKAARRNERFDRLQEAVNSLTSDHREVLYLARIKGLPMKDVAHQMHRSVDAVKQLMSRALKQLRVKFGDTGSLSLPDRSLTLERTSDDEECRE